MTWVAELFSQGEEVVTGQTLDTNANWLAAQLTQLGFRVRRHNTVGDQLPDLISVFREISERADICVCTGGLGPTTDDLTAEALASSAGVELVFNADAMADIKAYFDRRLREMPAVNRKQAYFPSGAEWIVNPVGTAPGFSFKMNRCWFVCLPGVPAEMQAMFQLTVSMQLSKRFVLRPDHLITIRTVGIGESAIQDMLAEVTIPNSAELGFRAALNEVQIKLLFSSTVAVAEMRKTVDSLVAVLGSVVYAVDGFETADSSLLSVIDHLMSSSSYQLLLTETVSFGALAQRCCGRAWLKQVFLHSTASSFDNIAAKPLNDSLIHLTQFSDAAVHEFSDCLAVVHLHLRLSLADKVYTETKLLSGGLQYKQQQAATYTLDFLRRFLLQLCP